MGEIRFPETWWEPLRNWLKPLRTWLKPLQTLLSPLGRLADTSKNLAEALENLAETSENMAETSENMAVASENMARVCRAGLWPLRRLAVWVLREICLEFLTACLGSLRAWLGPLSKEPRP